MFLPLCYGLEETEKSIKTLRKTWKHIWDTVQYLDIIKVNGMPEMFQRLPYHFFLFCTETQLTRLFRWEETAVMGWHDNTFSAGAIDYHRMCVADLSTPCPTQYNTPQYATCFKALTTAKKQAFCQRDNRRDAESHFVSLRFPSTFLQELRDWESIADCYQKCNYCGE